MQHDSRDTFDRLAGECDELKLRVIPGHRQDRNATTCPSKDVVASFVGMSLSFRLR